MLWKRVVPDRVSNKWSRWWKFQQSMFKKRWLEPDREKNGPITLFDFARPQDALDAALVDQGPHKGGWRISDDSMALGGYSHGNLQLVPTFHDYQNLLAGESLHQETILERLQQQLPLQEEQDTETKDSSSSSFVPFVRWSGRLDTRVPPDSKIERSGFCAIRSPEFPMAGLNLDGRYNALEVICRSDGRPYSVMVHVDSLIPDDVFTQFIAIEKTDEHRFDQVILLFQDFAVTSGGFARAAHREWDNTIKIKSIGMTLMDGEDGDFLFDLARIRAVNYDERGVIGTAD